MALGNCVVVNDTPENLETIGDAGLGYAGRLEAPALRKVLASLIAEPECVDKYRKLALARVREHYDWDRVTDQYEQIFQRLVTGEMQAGGNDGTS
jgi:glycosyltransferase involved in cell wall biosynthesis